MAGSGAQPRLPIIPCHCTCTRGMRASGDTALTIALLAQMVIEVQVSTS